MFRETSKTLTTLRRQGETPRQTPHRIKTNRSLGFRMGQVPDIPRIAPEVSAELLEPLGFGIPVESPRWLEMMAMSLLRAWKRSPRNVRSSG